MVRSIFGFCHMSLPHVRGAPGARGSPIERPERSSFRAVAEASAVISYQPSQGAFAASVPTSTRGRKAGVRSPLARLPQRGIGADRGFAMLEARMSGVAEAPPSLCSPVRRCPTPPSSRRDPRGVGPLAIVRLDPGYRDPKANPARCLPPSTRARPEPSSRLHRERCRNASMTEWDGDP